MNATILKYENSGMEYLVYDIGRNTLPLDERTVRTICARNFGIGSKGLLAGACSSNDPASLQVFAPNGEKREMDVQDIEVFCAYLRDAGNEPKARELQARTGKSQPAGFSASLVGRIYLTEEFAKRNHLAFA